MTTITLKVNGTTDPNTKNILFKTSNRADAADLETLLGKRTMCVNGVHLVAIDVQTSTVDQVKETINNHFA